MATKVNPCRDSLIAELMNDYGFETERELRRELGKANAWLRSCGIKLGTGKDAYDDDDGAMCKTVELGPSVSATCNSVKRLAVSYATGFDRFADPAHRRLLNSALALFLFTHPVTRAKIAAARE